MATLRVVISALENVAEQVIKAIALDIVANLRRAPSEGGTPVDTGWARANWQPRIGSPAQDVVGTNEAVGAAQATQEAGLGALLIYKISAGSVFITNNVAYITRLNEGSSGQAPKGFVQRAIQEAVNNVRTLA